MGAITKFVKGSFLDKNYVCCRTKTFHNVKVKRQKKDFSKNIASTHNLTTGPEASNPGHNSLSCNQESL